MCIIGQVQGATAPELDRQGRARSARSRNTRRLNGMNEAEDQRLGVIFGFDPASGMDLTATIEAARRALQEPEDFPRTATQRATKPNVSKPSPFGKLPTIGGK